MEYYPQSSGRKLKNSLEDYYYLAQEKHETNITIACTHELKQGVYRLSKSEGIQISPFGRCLFERLLELKEQLGEESLLSFLSRQSQLLSEQQAQIREYKREALRQKNKAEALEGEVRKKDAALHGNSNMESIYLSLRGSSPMSRSWKNFIMHMETKSWQGKKWKNKDLILASLSV